MEFLFMILLILFMIVQTYDLTLPISGGVRFVDMRLWVMVVPFILCSDTPYKKTGRNFQGERLFP